MVDNGCDPELSLRLGSGGPCPSSSESATNSRCIARNERLEGINDRDQQLQHRQQQITMFYGGQIWASDVTDLQARAIISMAKTAMQDINEDQQQHHQYEYQCRKSSPSPSPVSSRSMVPQQLRQELSMKRSLQRFLQKRKASLEAASPYSHHKRL